MVKYIDKLTSRNGNTQKKILSYKTTYDKVLLLKFYLIKHQIKNHLHEFPKGGYHVKNA